MPYRTGFIIYQKCEGAFDDWAFDTADATRKLDDRKFSGQVFPFYNGRSYASRDMTSPELKLGFPCVSIVPSWMADTPSGTWVEILLRVCRETAWSRWFSMGVWASDEENVRRHSVEGQEDEFAAIATDTVNLKSPTDKVQLRARLFSEDGLSAPDIRALGLSYAGERSSVADFPSGDPSMWNMDVPEVPAYSQMVYPDGGKVWCSPTCLTMIEDYWRKPAGPCEDRIRRNVAGVYDNVYRGYGNWAFNTAFASSNADGMDAFPVRFSSLSQLEPWIAAGVPVAMSVSWNNDDGRALTGAPIPKSSGHLTLLVGFDAAGNPVMHEPASPDAASVRRTYLRSELEARWISASGGMAYIVYPHGREVPGFPS